jgi:hypothetical protein
MVPEHGTDLWFLGKVAEIVNEKIVRDEKIVMGEEIV